MHSTVVKDMTETVFRRQVVRRITCWSVRFAAAKAKTPLRGVWHVSQPVCFCLFVCVALSMKYWVTMHSCRAKMRERRRELLLNGIRSTLGP